jgi:hypothetical protein
MNNAWRRRFSRRKSSAQIVSWGNYRLVAMADLVKSAVEQLHDEAKNTDPEALIFPAENRAQFLGPKRMISDNGLKIRLYSIGRELGMKFHPTFQILRRNFSTRGKTCGRPIDMQAQFEHSDSRTTLEIHTPTIGPELSRW